MSHRAVCFVMMPFGRKPDAAGKLIDFDRVYHSVIAPAIDEAGLVAIRADEEERAGFIHKLMYERLILSEFAIADLTIANANVYYELGIRHAARPASTVLIAASLSYLPFDVGPLRAMLYEVGSEGDISDVTTAKSTLITRLRHCRQHREIDSPLYELLDGYRATPIDHERTDTFRRKAAYSADLKSRLHDARKRGVEALDTVRDELGDIDTTEAGVVIDLLLSYRAISQWQRILDLAARTDAALARTVMVREQSAFALNRLGRSEEAERVLRELIADRGPSSETYGLLGRVFKDRWQTALKSGEPTRARGYLRQAIAAYRSGFEADWRDAYPGVNAATLMTLADPADPAIARLIPVVRYAVERRVAAGAPNAWDHATLLELAVIANDLTGAEEILADLLACQRDSWELETTARNLTLIADAREAAGESVKRLKSLIAELRQ